MYGTLVCGLKTLRVGIGHNQVPHALLNLEFLLRNIIIWYCLILTFSIALMKFMYICVWKSMRQMKDDLLARVIVTYVAFLSIWINVGSFFINIPR